MVAHLLWEQEAVGSSPTTPTTCPDLPSKEPDVVIGVPNDEIFVAIAAYREPELRRTIEQCIDTAAHPDRLHLGVCLQYDPDGPPETGRDCLSGISADIRQVSYRWTESKGGCWARHRAQGLYAGEGFTMQIDAHMRMADRWDRSLVDQMSALASDKPLITGQCPLYDVVDGVDVFPEESSVPVTVFERIVPEGWIWHPGVTRPDIPSHRRPTRVLSGGFVFTLGVWNREVRQDPDHLYTGEELALSIRSFTCGYDFWNPDRVVAWHRHHPQGNRKYIHDGDTSEVSMRDERAYRRLRMLHAGDPDRVLLPYSTGTARSVSEYHAWAGIDTSTWTVSHDARTGATPAQFVPSW